MLQKARNVRYFCLCFVVLNRREQKQNAMRLLTNTQALKTHFLG